MFELFPNNNNNYSKQVLPLGVVLKLTITDVAGVSTIYLAYLASGAVK